MSDTTITRYRGDTVADEFTIKDADGVVVDITGCTFIMTLDSLKTPPDNTTKVYDMVGTITNAAGGVVEFSPSGLQADQTPGKFYFDIQMTDAGSKVQTIMVGTYIYKQDITK